ncbi:MAG: hypothetical protein WCE90_05830 [Candidatus Zixiibacteriota bacterium]
MAGGIPDILAAIQHTFYVSGDVTGDGSVTVSDVIFLTNYLFRAGRAPSPLYVGDVNCDSLVDVSDIIRLVNYLYQNGAAPCPH